MTFTEPERELLLRFLDEGVSDAERQQVAVLLRTNAAARSFLREIAEQSVIVADLERTALAGQPQVEADSIRPKPKRRTLFPVPFRLWQWSLGTAAALVLVAATVQLFAARKTWVGKIAWVTGSSQVFASRGRIENTLPIGMRLSPGDTLETRSGDALVGLQLEDGSSLVLVGKSALRILAAGSDGMRFELGTGQLWLSPPSRPVAKALHIQTPTVMVQARNARFYLQTTATETTLRVNAGAAQVRQYFDGSVVEVAAGHQVTASLNRLQPLSVQPRSQPIHEWTCDLASLPKSVLGRWLPAQGPTKAHLGAVPVLWPLPNQKCILLYLAGLSVLANSERPLLLEIDSRLVIRGRTASPHTIRVGLVTQKPQGDFAGKFELDVAPDQLVSVGDSWEARLSVSNFQPLQPELAFSPAGLELTDIYALTVEKDAGLEIQRVALLPGAAGEQQ